jgi:hypothetical protein
MTELQRKYIKIIVPNDTRAAGVVLMYQSLLRSRFNLKKFYGDYPDATQVSDDMFGKIAELEAVLYPLSVLIKLIQTDKFGSLSYSFVLCFRTYVNYVINDTWYVADVGALRENHWSAAAKMPKRDWRGIPDDLTCTDARTGYEKMKMVEKSTAELGSIPRKLIPRIEKEYRSYCCKPTEDQLLSLACNPLSVQLGMQELLTMKTLLEESNATFDVKAFAVDFQEKAKERLEKEIRQLFSKELEPNLEEPVALASVDPGPETAQREEDIYRRARKKICSEARAGSMGDPVKKQVDDFFRHSMQWHDVLTDQGVNAEIVQQIGNTPDDHADNWHLIADHFDIMSWWESDGKKHWRFIYGVACLILPMPESNGGQERTFSTATWMDGKLNKRQTEATFQVKVVLNQNADFIKRAKMLTHDVHKQQASLSAKKLFELSAAWQEERSREVTKSLAKEKPIDYYYKHIATVTPTTSTVDDDSDDDMIDMNEENEMEKNHPVEVTVFDDIISDVSEEENRQLKTFNNESDSDTDTE